MYALWVLRIFHHDRVPDEIGECTLPADRHDIAKTEQE